MLTEYKDHRLHYYEDEQDRCQGEYKQWHLSGKPRLHGFYKDDKPHGEAKYWFESGELLHTFYKNNINITDEIEELVKDIKNISHKEKVIIKLKFGIECISDGIECRS